MKPHHMNHAAARRTRADYASYHHRRSVFYAHHFYVVPPYLFALYPAYGIWDAEFLAFMVDNAADQEYALMYYNHQNEEEIQQWRQDVDRLAAENEELRASLARMDQEVARLQGTPRDPSYVPETAQDVAFPPEVVESLAKSRG
jgi:hypothetical protein